MNTRKSLIAALMCLGAFNVSAQEIPTQDFNPVSSQMSFIKVDLTSQMRERAGVLMSSQPLTVDVSSLPPLKPSESSESVALLRQALKERGYESPITEGQDLNFFDEDLQLTLQAFQRDNGLVEDGIAGKNVYSSLSANNHVLGQQLLNYANYLEEKFMSARQAGQRKIVLVNIPSYNLKAIDLTTGKTIVDSRVIVGMPGRKTPIFTTDIVNLKYNPDWTPPPSLARKGKRYVKPGPNNPMGKMRFSTNNNLNIYLHHTNDVSAFEKSSRALSSGCVRVEQWQELAAFLADKKDEDIALKVNTNKTVFEKIEPVSVLMTYSLVDMDGDQVNQYKDIYSRGKSVLE